MTTNIPSPKPYVVFGYGSLIFKPPPHVIHQGVASLCIISAALAPGSCGVCSQVPGFLKGFVRRFAQSSSDHRGTPEKPGRVVTLIDAQEWVAFSDSDESPENDTVWGIAYTIDPTYEAEVREYLDYREKDGYTIDTTDVYTVVDGEDQVIVPQATVYVGHSDNASFVGSEPLDALANHIWRSVGPSGRNKDYLYDLAAAVRKLAPESNDSYLFALETRLRILDKTANSLPNGT